jgi:DNA-binding transcriptional regulator YhcF (GntR family)
MSDVRCRIRLRSTAKTLPQAQVELGRLIATASAGRHPDSAVKVAELIDGYVKVAEWDLSTRTSNDSYIRRVIRPALGHLEVRKVRGPLLDQLYARLKRCSNLACTGAPFTEHRNIPRLVIDPAGSRSAWEQIAEVLREAISTGMLSPGESLPSVRDIHELQGVRTSTVQRALSALADEGLLVIRQGRTATVAGETDAAAIISRGRRPERGHDCKLSGCRTHMCSPMKPKTIGNIHSILSGAFSAAERWEWVDRNPADSAKPPTITQGKKRHAVPRLRGG